MILMQTGTQTRCVTRTAGCFIMVVHGKNLWNQTISSKNKQKNVVMVVKMRHHNPAQHGMPRDDGGHRKVCVHGGVRCR